MRTATRAGPRTFDPVRLGGLETDAWAGYYRHEWAKCLRAFVGMVSAGFGMSRRRTLLGAWCILRANQAWAPYPDNDSDAAREYLRGFYALVDHDGALVLDPQRASQLEVEWWRLHRLHQREDAASTSALVDSLVALYSYVYSVDADSVRSAAEHRVQAMNLSDDWVEAGARADDPLLGRERLELVAAYTALRRAVEVVPS
jgi:hypothetical protein